ncbi:transcription factor IIA, alpha/beta subunit [Aulographum hederae CBS 113979]|uniref:Transcription factor IIA, alpha/beta subunit n=1 Tax=Aulographum hederae CBS 113979 TaxID=1176131 RepID=A0A6G1GXJ3_9PEZI|nr:transcription factor IIA, alpha/beta subunit [Aulographum hederae CBS 113979]
MSNQNVGQIYGAIIERCMEQAVMIFEEEGVDKGTLEELREAWQQRMSGYHFAQMPWDKPAEPVRPVPSSTPTLPSNANSVRQDNQQTADGMRIKAEPGYENSVPPYANPNYTGSSGLNPQIAQQRAASLLHQQYGNQANASIAAGYAQNHGAQYQNQQRPPGMHMPPQNQQRPNGQPQQPPQFHQQQPQPRNGLSAAQNDGSGDAAEEWAAHMESMRALKTEEVQSANDFLHARMTAMANHIDNSVMVPLAEQPSIKNKGKQRQRHLVAARASTSAHLPSIPQLDGELDNEEEQKPEASALKNEDDEFDEDAINSDLDDDDDGDQDDNEEDNQGHVQEAILCTYDKVQRVKNKWKCVLKDGVLHTGGKDYVFHKSNGEFEW